MARLMNTGMRESDWLRPRAEFGLSIRAATGSITGDWFLQHSADGVNWQNAHDTAFHDTDFQGTFKIPDGFIVKLAGGTGTNLVVNVGYTEEQLIRSIESDIYDNPVNI